MARLVVSVNLSDTGTRPILLQVDSDNDGPILYAGNRVLEQLLLRRAASGIGSRRYAQGIRCPASAGHETWQPHRSESSLCDPSERVVESAGLWRGRDIGYGAPSECIRQPLRSIRYFRPTVIRGPLRPGASGGMALGAPQF
jgi:hypothetical protein